MRITGSLSLALIAALFVKASIAAEATYSVFTDGYASGWSGQPWDATETVYSGATYAFRGSSSLKVVYISAWGGSRPLAAGPRYFPTLGYKDLNFAVYNHSAADDLWIVAANAGGAYGTHLQKYLVTAAPISLRKAVGHGFASPLRTLAWAARQ